VSGLHLKASASLVAIGTDWFSSMGWLTRDSGNSVTRSRRTSVRIADNPPGAMRQDFHGYRYGVKMQNLSSTRQSFLFSVF
jgi:hypothetical protein